MKKPIPTRTPASLSPLRPIDRRALDHVTGGGNDSEWKYVPVRRLT